MPSATRLFLLGTKYWQTTDEIRDIAGVLRQKHGEVLWCDPNEQGATRKALQQIVGCTGLVLLDGWHGSQLCKLLVEAALQLSLALYIYKAPGELSYLSVTQDYLPEHDLHEEQPPETILEEAIRITGGDRARDYGHPSVSQGRSADLVNAFLQGKYGSDSTQISPEDISWITILCKIARDMERPKRDSLVDIAGYARTIEKIRARESESDEWTA
jgi:hypothetical protein